jgi:UV DNA damage repair endonuclease
MLRVDLTTFSSGLVPEEDAPDIRANTWLPEVTDEQLERVGQGFLAHRHRQSLSLFFRPN